METYLLATTIVMGGMLVMEGMRDSALCT